MQWPCLREGGLGFPSPLPCPSTGHSLGTTGRLRPTPGLGSFVHRLQLPCPGWGSAKPPVWGPPPPSPSRRRRGRQGKVPCSARGLPAQQHPRGPEQPPPPAPHPWLCSWSPCLSAAGARPHGGRYNHGNCGYYGKLLPLLKRQGQNKQK